MSRPMLRRTLSRLSSRMSRERPVSTGNPGDIEKTFAAEVESGVFLHRDQCRSQGVGQVAHIRQKTIVLVRRKPRRSHPKLFPEGFDCRQGFDTG